MATIFDYKAASVLLEQARARVAELSALLSDREQRFALMRLERYVEKLDDMVRPFVALDDGIEGQRVLAYFRRFEEMRKRFGKVPSVEEYESASARDRVALRVRLQAHQVIARVMEDLTKSSTFDQRDAELLNRFWLEYSMLPHALKGERFKPRGRGPGAVRKAIQRLRTKTPNATALELWLTLKHRPPRTWEFFDNRLGKYIEHGEKGRRSSTNWATFQNLVSKEKNPKR